MPKVFSLLSVPFTAGEEFDKFLESAKTKPLEFFFYLTKAKWEAFSKPCLRACYDVIIADLTKNGEEIIDRDYLGIGDKFNEFSLIAQHEGHFNVNPAHALMKFQSILEEISRRHLKQIAMNFAKQQQGTDPMAQALNKDLEKREKAQREDRIKKVGLVVLGVVGLAIIVGIVFVLRKKKPRK